MTVETKFNIGDKFFILNENKVKECTVKYINVLFGKLTPIIRYRYEEIDPIILKNIENFGFSGNFWITCEKMFHTKEELLKSL